MRFKVFKPATQKLKNVSQVQFWKLQPSVPDKTKEPKSFLRKHPGPVIIDELQYAPSLCRYLKVAVDASRNRHGQFLLTGSQKFTLMKSASESLRARADLEELATLSLAEIQTALPKRAREAAIVRGGFPELQADTDIDHVAFYDLRCCLGIGGVG